MIIIAAAQHFKPWFESNLENDILVRVSNLGYSCDALRLEWLKQFERFSTKRQIRALCVKI